MLNEDHSNGSASSCYSRAARVLVFLAARHYNCIVSADFIAMRMVEKRLFLSLHITKRVHRIQLVWSLLGSRRRNWGDCGQNGCMDQGEKKSEERGEKNKRNTNISPYDLKESCRFKGIPSCPKPSSSSVCLGSRTGSIGGPSTMSLVL